MDAKKMLEILNSIADAQKLTQADDLLSQVIEDTVPMVELSDDELGLIAAAGTGETELLKKIRNEQHKADD